MKLKEDTSSYFWWAKLVVAVLAIPSLGGIISSAMPPSGITQLIVFVVACWLCTYLGMKLMQNTDKKD